MDTSVHLVYGLKIDMKELQKVTHVNEEEPLLEEYGLSVSENYYSGEMSNEGVIFYDCDNFSYFINSGAHLLNIEKINTSILYLSGSKKDEIEKWLDSIGYSGSREWGLFATTVIR